MRTPSSRRKRTPPGHGTLPAPGPREGPSTPWCLRHHSAQDNRRGRRTSGGSRPPQGQPGSPAGRERMRRPPRAAGPLVQRPSPPKTLRVRATRPAAPALRQGAPRRHMCDGPRAQRARRRPRGRERRMGCPSPAAAYLLSCPTATARPWFRAEITDSLQKIRLLQMTAGRWPGSDGPIARWLRLQDPATRRFQAHEGPARGRDGPKRRLPTCRTRIFWSESVCSGPRHLPTPPEMSLARPCTCSGYPSGGRRRGRGRRGAGSFAKRRLPETRFGADGRRRNLHQQHAVAQELHPCTPCSTLSGSRLRCGLH